MDVRDKVTLSSVANDRPQESSPITYRNPKEAARAKVVDALAEKFFNPVAIAKEDGESVQSEEALKRVQANELLTGQA
jgi:hypothetical protein